MHKCRVAHTCCAGDLLVQVSGEVFTNLLHRDLQFHLERKIGVIGRVIDRGGRSINNALTTMLFHVVPTTLEIGSSVSRC
jgi:ABC-type transport system involved in Fe-S cluster assembly fused permease/ATPase subunit